AAFEKTDRGRPRVACGDHIRQVAAGGKAEALASDRERLLRFMFFRLRRHQCVRVKIELDLFPASGAGSPALQTGAEGRAMQVEKGTVAPAQRTVGQVLGWGGLRHAQSQKAPIQRMQAASPFPHLENFGTGKGPHTK